ncbi:hypothetical protein HQ602_19310 [Rhodococcus kroppenstedtii]|nr:hypothetical protein [Rhodococcus kroppenstedtii]MBY6438522.1 hypothetical protein [Rhodococcus kroppenstedtii]
MPDRADADAAAAGRPGFAEAYANAFNQLVTVLAVALVVTSTAVYLL